jgi:glycine/D-amino acid oxidase-like deaminating enzyme
VQPAKLARGLAVAAERRGATIHERTPALTVSPRLVGTPQGSVRARWVVRATEGYTADLPGLRRALLPLWSSMIVTEPLDPGTWQQIGWQGRETIDDAAHVYCYLQRTADDRIAIGGRGRPYRFGSGTERANGVPDGTVRHLRARLARLFPVLQDAPIAHAWTGVFGVARDWAAAVHCDRTSGMCRAGGYAGEGVAAANLAARTLRDLILGRDTELTRLPWVAHRARATALARGPGRLRRAARRRRDRGPHGSPVAAGPRRRRALRALTARAARAPRSRAPGSGA